MIFLDLFLTFFKIGAFTFGGGYAMLPLIQEEVISKGWIKADELVNFIAVAESTPGPFAINISTYIGSEMGGAYGFFGHIFGSFCSTLGCVLPSFIIILIAAHFFEKFKESKVIRGIMSGLKPAVIGLIAAAVISIANTVFGGYFTNGINLENPMLWVSAATTAVMTVLAFRKVHPFIIICISAVVGIVFGIIL